MRRVALGGIALATLASLVACNEDHPALEIHAEAVATAAAAPEAPSTGGSSPCAEVDAAVLSELAKSQAPTLRRYVARIGEIVVALRDGFRAQGHASEASGLRVESACHRLVVAVVEDAETQRQVDEASALVKANAGSRDDAQPEVRDALIQLQHVAVVSISRVETLLADADRWTFDELAVESPTEHPAPSLTATEPPHSTQAD
jgi:hypothetical protein